MEEVKTKTTERQWKVMEAEKDMQGKLPNLPPIIANLLWRRGVKTAEEAEVFLKPKYERDIHDSFLFGDMERAVSRIYKAIDRGEHITVHGDYDADGVTGSAVLLHTLEDLIKVKESKSKLDYYIPHREDEGYGLHIPTVDILKDRGTNLIITVDCGIASREAIAYANDCAMDTIVVDHHEFPEELPEAILIHPRLPGEAYPFPYLAAVGVAWKLACGLYSEARKNNLKVHPGAEKWLLDFVSIATITDIVPLVGENRTLVHYGLKVLRQSPRLGLKKMFEIGSIDQEKADTFTIGFQIGPRINAAGRMEHAETALKLMMTKDHDEAEILAQKLQDHNSARQSATGKIFEEARKQVLDQTDEHILMVIADGWPAGLVGLVAGKLVSEFNKPVLAMGRTGEQIVGSGRSVSGFHITEALRATGDCVQKCGGHPQACGFTIIGEENFEKFQKQIREIAKKQLKDADLNPVLEIDAELDLEDLDWDLVDILQSMEPFGEKNPLPRFVSHELEVVNSDCVGNGSKHLRLLMRSPKGTMQKFIGFGFGGNLSACAPGNKIEVVYEVGINVWNGSREIQCKIVDIR